MAEDTKGQTTQQTQAQSGQDQSQPGERQGQGQTSHPIQQHNRGRSRGMARRGILSPSLFSMSPFTLLATSPFALIRQFAEEMDELSSEFGTSGNAPAQQGATGLAAATQGNGANLAQPFFTPQIDVVERDGQLVVRVDLPGVGKDDVRVEITDDALIVEGRRQFEHEENKGGVYYVERSYGTFRRRIPLSEGVDAEKATATFNNGVLEISMPAPQRQSRSRQLEIHDSGQSGGQPQTQARTAGSQS